MFTIEQIEKAMKILIERYAVFINEEHMKTIKSSYSDLLNVLKEQ